MIVPARICSSSTAATTRKYLPILRWLCGQRPERRQHRVHRRLVGVVEPVLVDEQHAAEREEREAEAGPGPHEGVGGRRVADFRLDRASSRSRTSSYRDGGRRWSAPSRSGNRRSAALRSRSGCRPGSSRSSRSIVARFLAMLVAQRGDGAGQGVGDVTSRWVRSTR